ncbi:MAG: TlyA family RNA methyltransferase [Candidatus Dadabacteria bacterium]|nr:TlyA family RNA methyltransferase [Candidatus Dadabacteria bacterium]NIS08286.1 TlyA family RNA methyltransferase [Candidatus Dadabacteria bacterium]NIV41570.1 TlyA family rRNA (cytidine-2'-O)-methyltransferase [Candidatus Dadabacteria bacterium]NIY21777.1 TlyA family rRNA (cytidine-2'-O)-methyltransferase [Candidatus Dadabacteria bacterium]
MKEKTKKKKRIDIVLHERGFADSRNAAKSLLMSGCVFVDGQKVDKAGKIINLESDITVKDTRPRYVGRGGLKLQKALGEFLIDVKDKTCLDIGASTGGFTDCLLQHGAKKVYAVDVGYGQLDWKLRNDPRVILKERLNARYLKKKDIGEPVDIITIDVSFISITKVAEPGLAVLRAGGTLIGLIKPQFEVGRGEVGKGGIVREPEKHAAVIKEVEDYLDKLGFSELQTTESPILGAEGNKEFLLKAVKPQ